MLKRKAYDAMTAWLNAPTKKALLVKGARQVGKSFLVNQFAQDHFEQVATFDLIENTRARDSFAQAQSANDLMLRLSIESETPLVPHQTAIVIDEIQEAPNILTFIKYLVQQDNYRFILTGSLLGVKLVNVDSLPVGFLAQIEMFPLDFEEFCWASNLNEVAFDTARECFAQEQPLPDYLYTRMQDLFHRYLMVGGMPDAVNAFIATNNIDEVRTVHADLHSLYRADITKYAPVDLRLVIREIYDLIPSEAAARSRRFRISSINNVKRFSQVENNVLWLSQAGVALPVYNVTAPVHPLLLVEQHNKFKLFYLDAGMLASAYPKTAYEGLLDGKPSMNMGGVYEAVVAQQLIAHGFELRYFSNKKIGELDFLAEHLDGSIDAIEVKSGANYTSHAALDNALSTEGYAIDRAFVFAETNIAREGKILYAPVFLASLLENE